jgi:flagellar hook-basal body complex protein FliE
MSPLGSVNPLHSSPLTRGIDAPLPKIALPGATPAVGAPGESFGQVIDGLVSAVEAKSAASQAATRKVLLGESDHLHHSIIAMQESSVAFTMMVEMRNKLVESYQELMRMQV